MDILEDIYSVHSVLLFATYRFKSYTHQEFIRNVKSSQYNGYIKEESLEKAVTSMNSINLYPSFIIDDDLYQIWKYLFAASRFVSDHIENIYRVTTHYLHL